MYAHHVARARVLHLPLLDDARARWLWHRLRRAFPHALAVCLMPDHLHMVAPAERDARRRLASILGALARVFRLGEVWRPVPEAQPLPTPDKVRRAIRYALLNPSRPWTHAGRRIHLVPEPLMWPWSTLRDVIGAVHRPWVPAESLQAVLAWRGHGFTQSFHAYVSSDPCVRVTGTPFPMPAEPRKVPTEPLGLIAKAAAAATRNPISALRVRGEARTMFVHLASRQGWTSPVQLAEACAVHPNTVWRLMRGCAPDLVTPAALCLGDARLTCSSLDDVRARVGG